MRKPSPSCSVGDGGARRLARAAAAEVAARCVAFDARALDRAEKTLRMHAKACGGLDVVVSMARRATRLRKKLLGTEPMAQVQKLLVA